MAEIAAATVMAKEMERGIAVATEKAKDTEAGTAVATTRTNKPIPPRAFYTCETYSAATQPTQSNSLQAFVTKSKKERETICLTQLAHSIH